MLRSRALSLPMSLCLALAVPLSLAACGDGHERNRDHPAPTPALGFELAVAAPSDPAAGQKIDLGPDELAARLATGKIRLIDVRTPEEAAEGVIPGAEHIPLDTFDPARLGPDDGREVVLYCRSGRRSAIAGQRLAAFTGIPVAHLAGGIRAWEQAGRPLTQR